MHSGVQRAVTYEYTPQEPDAAFISIALTSYRHHRSWWCFTHTCWRHKTSLFWVYLSAYWEVTVHNHNKICKLIGGHRPNFHERLLLRKEIELTSKQRLLIKEIPGPWLLMSTNDNVSKTCDMISSCRSSWNPKVIRFVCVENGYLKFYDKAKSAANRSYQETIRRRLFRTQTTFRLPSPSRLTRRSVLLILMSL